jgi:hypothetical protein
MCELYVRSIYLNLFGWRGARAINVWEPLVWCLTVDWTTEVQSRQRQRIYPAEAKDFSSSLCVQTS